MLAVTYFLPQPDLRWLYALLAVAAVVVMFPVVMAIMPSVIGCCAMAAPVVGQLMVGAVIIAAFAVVTKPK